MLVSYLSFIGSANVIDEMHYSQLRISTGNYKADIHRSASKYREVAVSWLYFDFAVKKHVYIYVKNIFRSDLAFVS